MPLLVVVTSKMMIFDQVFEEKNINMVLENRHFFRRQVCPRANDHGDSGSMSSLKLQVTREHGQVVQTTQYGQADA